MINDRPSFRSGIEPVPCEFCREFQTPDVSRFRTIYGPDVPSRVVARSGSFVAMPTLGQLLKGSLLLLPVEHFETFAAMPHDMRSEFVLFAGQVASRLRCWGMPVLLEHGARSWTGGACGVYHAHLHAVPVPKPLTCMEVLPRVTNTAPSLFAAWSELRKSSEYLLFQDTRGCVAFLDLDQTPVPEVTSQFFRRFLVEWFSLDKAPDWRLYPEPEPMLVETLAWLGAK